jgi:hypothetical protein
MTRHGPSAIGDQLGYRWQCQDFTGGVKLGPLQVEMASLQWAPDRYTMPVPKNARVGFVAAGRMLSLADQ